MSKKAQMSVGIVIMVFLTVIVGVILLDAAADEVGRSTSLVTLTNQSYAIGANGTFFNFTGFKNFDNVVIYNYTNESGKSANDAAIEPRIILAGNYTIHNNQVVDGAEAVQLELRDAEFASTAYGLNITATAQPTAYVSDSGARAVINLVLIFFALAVAVVALSPTLRSKVLNM